MEFELYIHIPFCLKKCLYCDFLSTCGETPDVIDEYMEALCTEIKWQGKRYLGVVTSIYIGGGTPSIVPLGHIETMMRTILTSFRVRRDAEISMEVNPGTVTATSAVFYKNCGINRISIGLQSANDEELRLLGRIHNFDRFVETYTHLRRAGFDNINIDIMTGLPGQTPAKLAETLSKVLILKPEHISAYSLMIEPDTPFYEKYGEDAKRQEQGLPTKELPTEDEAYELMKRTQMTLKNFGFNQYEISNYAVLGRECRHNIGYWTRVPYIGIGLGAASLLHPEMEENILGRGSLEHRMTNTRHLYDYIDDALILADIDAKTFWMDVPIYDGNIDVIPEDAMAEYCYLGMRMTDGIRKNDFYRQFGERVDVIYKDALAKLTREGLLKEENGRIFLTDNGLDLSTYALSEFILESEDSM